MFKQNRDSTSFDNVLLSRARTALDSDYLTEKYTGAQNQKLGRVFLKRLPWWIQTSWVVHQDTPIGQEVNGEKIVGPVMKGQDFLTFHYEGGPGSDAQEWWTQSYIESIGSPWGTFSIDAIDEPFITPSWHISMIAYSFWSDIIDIRALQKSKEPNGSGLYEEEVLIDLHHYDAERYKITISWSNKEISAICVPKYRRSWARRDPATELTRLENWFRDSLSN